VKKPARPTRLAILGSTGSIGRQAIEVARAHPELLTVVALVAGNDSDALDEQARDLRVDATGLGSEDAQRMASSDDVDLVLNAIVGAAGLKASVAALSSGKTLALANKESLVAGGEVCLKAASEGGGRIVPVDSEHVSLARCLAKVRDGEVGRVVLTASGGPFKDRSDLSDVTRDEALAHPTWSMGPKITVDSATLMNKGFEAIEAHHLFDLDYERIAVIVHPQSIVHGIVELIDGSMLMHAAVTDMKIPIAWALLGDELPAGEPLDLIEKGPLSFETLDEKRFPLVGLAYEAGRAGGTAPAVLNAANEQAVQAFLDGSLPFDGIARAVTAVVNSHRVEDATSIDNVLAADAWARAEARSVMQAVVSS
jgi:1-deoxy-D-xylulose-5-phosphate reductoisomerase